MLKQIGNAVPPLLGRALASATKRALAAIKDSSVVTFKVPIQQTLELVP
ncbi:DNA cytosine methyltransferase [Streptomyces sp. GMY01]|nr:DNA cytosine methyltransferase [Streptomyces sp. GMY02]NMO35423.1 DNA cytosine methyltransferase [Streptomyces sp. GMY02]